MRICRVVIVLIFSFFVLGQVNAIAEDTQNVSGFGEKLVRDFWVSLKNRDIKTLGNFMSPGFQSIHQDGARNRKEELELIKGLNLGDYKLSDFKVTHDGPVIIATYFVSTRETIDGKRLSSTPAPRMTVFLETRIGWKLIAHANLKALKK